MVLFQGFQSEIKKNFYLFVCPQLFNRKNVFLKENLKKEDIPIGCPENIFSEKFQKSQNWKRSSLTRISSVVLTLYTNLQLTSYTIDEFCVIF